MSPFRILVADDQPIFRLGLCSLLGSHEGWEVCGEVADGRDAVEKCRKLKPDLLILDICMPKLNGLEAARQILKYNPQQPILILTSVDSEQVVRECLEAGVRGWVFKSDRTDDLITAVEAMRRQKSIFSSRVSDLIVEGFKRHSVGPASANVPKLSAREREVVQLVTEGKRSKEIAIALNVSVATAETHRTNIFRKLKLHSVAELVMYAVRNEIVHLQFPVELHFAKQEEDRNRSCATPGYVALPEPGNGRAGGVAPTAN
ncbi:MAG: response regulator transcription factor [Candidatus Sulfotelmatobacter sp.]